MGLKWKVVGGGEEAIDTVDGRIVAEVKMAGPHYTIWAEERRVLPAFETMANAKAVVERCFAAADPVFGPYPDDHKPAVEDQPDGAPKGKNGPLIFGPFSGKKPEAAPEANKPEAKP